MLFSIAGGGFNNLGAQIFAPEPVSWQDPVKTTASYPGSQGSTLTRTTATSPTPAWDGDAISTKWIYGDGWIEFKAGTTNKRLMVGFAEANPDRTWTSLLYAFYLNNDATWDIRESGAVGTVIGTSNYAVGDKFRIERIGTTVKYYVNDVLKSTSTAQSQGVLFVDTSFYDGSGSINSCRYYGPNSPEDVLWINPVNTSGAYTAGGQGSQISKTVATSAYDSDAVSSKAIASDGMLRFRLGQTTKVLAVGLATANTDRNYTSLNYAFLANGATLSIVESGTTKSTVGSYVVGDVFSIHRTGTLITYKKNGTVIYTSTVASSGLLFADCSIYTNGGSFTNCQIEGYPLSESPAFNGTLITTTNSPAGSVLASTGASGGAVTVAMIPGTGGLSVPNNGILSFRFSQASGKNVEGGLTTSRSTSPTASTINFGIKGRSDGLIEIIEAGASVGTFGAYATTDLFQVRRVSGTIEYIKDGALLRSVAAPSGSLSGAFVFTEASGSVKDITFYTGYTDLLWRKQVHSTPSWSPINSGGLTRDASTVGWTADALGTRQLVGDGYVQWSFVNTGKDAMVGLSPSDKNNSYTDLQYAIYAHGSAINDPLLVYENGTNTGTFGTFTAADTFRIRRVGSTIYYSRIDSAGAELVLKTSTITYLGPLVVDCSLQDLNVAVTNCRIAYGDSDGDGIDDQWEAAEFGSLVETGTADADGDGANNVHEFYNGTDPNAIRYDGTPTLTILSGNYQSGPVSSYFSTPLKVKVANSSGTALRNAPLRFQVTSGAAKLAMSNSGTLVTQLSLVTDINGEAMVYAYAPPTLVAATVQAAADDGSQLTQVNFTETASAAPVMSNLRTWVKADSGVVTDADGRVISVTDQSGNNHGVSEDDPGFIGWPVSPFAVDVRRPTLVLNQMNGRPVIRFSGGGNCLAFADGSFGVSASDIFVVLKADSDQPGVNRPLWRISYSMSGDGPGTYYPDSSGSIQDATTATLGLIGSNKYIVGDPEPPLDQSHFYNVTSKDSLWQARINGVLELEQKGSFSYYAPNQMALLGTDDAYSYTSFKGDIAEILVYDRQLTDGERDVVGTYLSQKYGLMNAPVMPLQGVGVYPISKKQNLLTWTRPSSKGHEMFLVERRALNGTFQEIAKVWDTGSYLDSDFPNLGPTCTYRVRYIGYGGLSPYSPEVTVRVTGSTTMVPLDPASVRLWVRADAGVAIKAGNYANAWRDQSGNGNDLFLSAPLQESAAKGVAADTGRPALVFDGLNDGFKLPAAVWSGTSASEAFVVMRCNLTGSAKDRILWGQNYYDGTRSLTYYPNVSGGIQDGFCVLNTNFNYVSTQSLGATHLYNPQSTNGLWQASINGVPQFGTTSNVFSQPVAGWLGASDQFNYDTGFKGEISEVIIFGRQLSEQERRCVRDYLGWRHGVLAMHGDIDIDGDGLTLAQEVASGSNPFVPNANGADDADGDGLTLTQELALGTNPFDPDTDHDGVWDNSDPLPLDPTVSGGTPGDTTPPVITLTNPPLGPL